jgi:hypothetical protein
MEPKVKYRPTEQFAAEFKPHWCHDCQRLIKGCIHCHRAECKPVKRLPQK